MFEGNVLRNKQMDGYNTIFVLNIQMDGYNTEYILIYSMANAGGN